MVKSYVLNVIFGVPSRRPTMSAAHSRAMAVTRDESSNLCIMYIYK